MKKTTAFILGVLLALGLLCGWYYLSMMHNENEELYQTNQLTNANLAKAEMKVKDLSALRDALQDSIVKLNVEKGQVEIERNRAEATVRTNMSSYVAATIIHDTARMVKACDSLVVTSIPDYAAIDRIRTRVIDSMLFVQQVRSFLADTAQYYLQDSIGRPLKAENQKLIEEDQKTKKKLKTSVKVGIGGFIAAAVEFLIIMLK
jgi:hypothetical protein